mgnify:CR=1 FL=1
MTDSEIVLGLPTTRLTASSEAAARLQYRRATSGRYPAPSAGVRGTALSRDGVNYILQEALGKAAKRCPTLAARRVSPHVLRHTTAMHLLQSGVDITVIALWLGHESPEITHMYVEADLKIKERALRSVTPAGKGSLRFQPGDALLAFLDTL